MESTAVLVHVASQSKAENTDLYNYKTTTLKDNLIIDLNIGQINKLILSLSLKFGAGMVPCNVYNAIIIISFVLKIKFAVACINETLE